jgi:hypothetical protein
VIIAALALGQSMLAIADTTPSRSYRNGPPALMRTSTSRPSAGSALTAMSAGAGPRAWAAAQSSAAAQSAVAQRRMIDGRIIAAV